MIPPVPPALSRPAEDTTSAAYDRPAQRMRYAPIIEPMPARYRKKKTGLWPAREWPAWTDEARYSLAPEDLSHWPEWTDEIWTTAEGRSRD